MLAGREMPITSAKVGLLPASRTPELAMPLLVDTIAVKAGGKQHLACKNVLVVSDGQWRAPLLAKKRSGVIKAHRMGGR